VHRTRRFAVNSNGQSIFLFTHLHAPLSPLGERKTATFRFNKSPGLSPHDPSLFIAAAYNTYQPSNATSISAKNAPPVSGLRSMDGMAIIAVSAAGTTMCPGEFTPSLFYMF